MIEINRFKKCIMDSMEYREYAESKEKLRERSEVMDILDRVRDMQKIASNMEHNGDINYVFIDDEIEGLMDVVKGTEVYINYIRKKNAFIVRLGNVKSVIEDYINSVIW